MRLKVKNEKERDKEGVQGGRISRSIMNTGVLIGPSLVIYI